MELKPHEGHTVYLINVTPRPRKSENAVYDNGKKVNCNNLTKSDKHLK